MKPDASRGGRRPGELGGAGAAAGRARALALVFALGAAAALPPDAGAVVVAEAGLAAGFDSNVFEAVNRDRWVGDTFARMEANVERDGPAGARRALVGQLRFAGEQYVRSRSEDRNLVLGSLGWRLRGAGAGASVRWTEQLVDRTHADSLSLGRHQVAHAGFAALSPGARVSWLAEAFWVDTRAGGPAARRGWRVGGDLQRVLGGAWSAGPRCEGGEVRFDAPAIADWQEGTISERGEDQRDRSVLVGAGLQRSVSPLLQLAYGYRAIDSNSFGYSQVRHELSLSLACLLPWRISLQAIGLWQEPRYRDRGFAQWLLRDDPEDLDLGARSGATLRLRRPLGGEFSAEAQAGWERNEARISGRYYERIQCLVAIRYGSRR